MQYYYANDLKLQDGNGITSTPVTDPTTELLSTSQVPTEQTESGVEVNEITLAATAAEGLTVGDKVNGISVPSVIPSEGLTLAERDNLLQNFVRMSLETNFEMNIWLIKRNYWAYASRRLGKHFVTTRISHWIFEFIAEERLKFEQRQNIASDLERARKWVTDYVKIKNTHHKVPIFRYIRMIQPKVGSPETETVMRILGITNVRSLFWSSEELEKQAADDKEVEVYQQKQRALLRQLQSKDGEATTKESTPKVTKKKKNKRKPEEEEEEEKRTAKRKSESKEESTPVTDVRDFPAFEVWEDEESYLVALQVPAYDRTVLEHKVSIVGLEVSGGCSLPTTITRRWPGTFEWYPREWSRRIIFPKAIEPSTSGLVDIHCEGMLFYKCPKQNIEPRSSSTTSIKLAGEPRPVANLLNTENPVS